MFNIVGGLPLPSQSRTAKGSREPGSATTRDLTTVGPEGEISVRPRREQGPLSSIVLVRIEDQELLLAHWAETA